MRLTDMTENLRILYSNRQIWTWKLVDTTATRDQCPAILVLILTSNVVKWSFGRYFRCNKKLRNEWQNFNKNKEFQTHRHRFLFLQVWWKSSEKARVKTIKTHGKCFKQACVSSMLWFAKNKFRAQKLELSIQGWRTISGRPNRYITGKSSFTGQKHLESWLRPRQPQQPEDRLHKRQLQQKQLSEKGLQKRLTRRRTEAEDL